MTSAVRERLVGRAVHALGHVESTQAETARLAAGGAPEGTVVTAEHQTRGRGRRGRDWLDSPGDSLLLSVLLRPPVPASRAPQLCLVAAVAVAEALEETSGITVGIRWPNDVLVEERKLCGILAEASSAPDGRLAHMILGIGINVNQGRFPEALASTATSVRLAAGRPADRRALLQRVLDALDRRYAEFLVGGLDTLREAWRRRSVTLGRRVRTPDGREGVAEDLDAEGALLIRGDDGALIRLTSGETAHAPGD